MRKIFSKVIACFMLSVSCVSTACGFQIETHQCQYTQKIVEEKYLKSEATCQQKAEYFYSCACGEKGAESFTHGVIAAHDYTAQVVSEQYFAGEANCQHGTAYYLSCTGCGKMYHRTFYDGQSGECSFTQEVPEWKYLKADPTTTSQAVFYKSCVCGATGQETFLYGDVLKEYTEAEKAYYAPTSLTVSLYEPENCIYSFTYNTQKEPLRPVLQFEKANGETLEIPAWVEPATSYEHPSEKVIHYYIVKAEVALEKNVSYTYRAYDKYVDVGTEYTTLKTADPLSESFTFTHLSDTQYGAVEFGDTLKCLQGNTDFILHSGDVVEYSKFEFQWTEMLHDNFEYISTIPMMAISGNHETTYRNGASETYKHFHNKMPKQSSVELGYFYSFVYGNVKFIMLNTNELDGTQLKSEQYNWLMGELMNNNSTWTVVVMHNPIYSAGKYGSDPSKNQIALGLRTQLQGIFAEYGVDMVLQGHDHLITRTYPINAMGEPQTESWITENGVEYSVNPSGVLYMMNGTGGSQVRTPYLVEDGYYHYAEGSNVSSWADFEVSGNQLKVCVKYYDKATDQVKTYQTWGIKKEN